MATHRVPIRINRPDANVFPDRIGNRITATNEIGNFIAYVLTSGSDKGVYAQITVPANYVGTPVIEIVGILDGAPGASDVLGFGVTGLSRGDNEAADAAFSAEDIASATIGSGGTNHSDEDQYVETIALSNLSGLAAGEEVYIYLFRDHSVNTYAGEFLLTSLRFLYADA